MTDAFLENQLSVTEGDILSLNTAIRFLTDNPTAKYKLDTSLSEQEVTRQDLGRLKDMRSALYEERDLLIQRTNGQPLMVHAPGW